MKNALWYQYIHIHDIDTDFKYLYMSIGNIFFRSYILNWKVDPGLAHQAFVSVNFECITHITGVNMQCLHYAFYSVLSLKKHRVYVKGLESNPQTPRILPHHDRSPGFENSWIRHCIPRIKYLWNWLTQHARNCQYVNLTHLPSFAIANWYNSAILSSFFSDEKFLEHYAMPTEMRNCHKLLWRLPNFSL